MRRSLSISMVLMLVATFALLFIAPSGADNGIPPTISGVRVLNTGEHYFEVTWQTDVPTKGGVEYGETKDYGDTAPEFGNNYETIHYLNVTDLKRGTKYHFRIFAENFNGDMGYSGDAEVATFPYEEEGGLPWWAWTAIALAVIAVMMYLFFPRGGGTG